ncbi:hypothetical protein MAR_029458, partial [Mya arenaria]
MDMIYYLIGYLGAACLSFVFCEEELTKCLKSKREKIQIACPKGNVLYAPSISAGVSESGRCTRGYGDCTGTPRALQHQMNACSWKKKCDVILSTNNVLPCGTPGSQVNKNITYVVIGKLNCIPKDRTFSICSKKDRHLFTKSDFTVGVIKSHKRFPVNRPTCRKVREMKIPVKLNSSVMFEVSPFKHNTFPLGLNIYRVERETTTSTPLYNITVVHGNTTSAIRVVADFRWKRKHLSGFMLAFIVRAVIKQCGRRPGEMQLSCGRNKVIYFPSISASSVGRSFSQNCTYGRSTCGGLTPSLLVQRNSCYWKPRCSIDWRGRERILLSRDSSCIGQPVALVGSEGHRCVREENIYDLCSNCTRFIDASWGIVRSHPQYPWFFTSHTDCKAIIQIGRRRVLTLTIQDINLDPNGRDKLTMYQVGRNGERNYVISAAKEARIGRVITVQDGKLVIRLKRFKRSKSGRGLVLVFQREIDSPYETTTPRTEGIVNDAYRGPEIRLTNRMLCSGNRKL